MTAILAFIRRAITDPKSEPAFWLGLLGSVFAFIIQNLVGHGTISADTGTTIVNLVTGLASFVAGILIRGNVTPLAAPTLPVGTQVTTPDNTKATVVGG